MFLHGASTAPLNTDHNRLSLSTPSSPAQAQHREGTQGAPEEAQNVPPAGWWGLQLCERHRGPKQSPRPGITPSPTCKETWHVRAGRGSCCEDRWSWSSSLHTWVRLGWGPGGGELGWPTSPLQFSLVARQAQACEDPHSHLAPDPPWAW